MVDAVLSRHPVDLAVPDELFTFVPPMKVALVRQIRNSALAYCAATCATLPQAQQRRDLAERVFVVLTARMHSVFGSPSNYHAALLQAKIVQRALGATPTGAGGAYSPF